MVMEYVVGVVIVLLAVEGSLYLLLSRLRARFKNVIITGKDKVPKLNEKGLEKFFNTSYDPELGWVRKPNTSKIEKTLAGDKSYHINALGSRMNPGHEDLPLKIVSYGDSYTFGREINDNETWQYFLATVAQCNVANFGVGNYGLDQAFLRFKRELPKIKDADVVVIGVVPDTIQRNLSVWKHYSEFGNTFGFKPRFVIENNKLRLVPNFVDSREKFSSLQDIVPKLNKYDYFYKTKFKRDLFSFPYTLSLLRYPVRKIPLLGVYTIAYFLELIGIDWKKSRFIPAAQARGVVTYNVKDLIAYYNNKPLLDLSIKILEEFASLAKNHNITPVLVMLPMHNDLEYMRKTKDVYYSNFIEQTSSFMHCIDMGVEFLKLEDMDTIFFRKDYGGNYKDHGDHYNAEGNKMVAETIHAFLKEH